MKSLLDIVSGKEMFSAITDESVYEVVTRMAENNVGAVPVLDREGRMRGIFSERDVMKRCVAGKIDMNNTKLEDVMTKGVIIMESHDTYEDCLKIMRQENIRHIPVRAGEKLIGMVSMRDLMQAEVEEKKEEIEQLNTYIYYYK